MNREGSNFLFSISFKSYCQMRVRVPPPSCLEFAENESELLVRNMDSLSFLV